MRRRAEVVHAGKAHLLLSFGQGQYLRIKKSAFPALGRDMRVTITMTTKVTKRARPRTSEEKELDRRERWITDQLLGKGRGMSIEELCRRAHLQLVEDDEK